MSSGVIRWPHRVVTCRHEQRSTIPKVPPITIVRDQLDPHEVKDPIQSALLHRKARPATHAPPQILILSRIVPWVDSLVRLPKTRAPFTVPRYGS